ncbi:class II myosin, partial [Elasticomyces elasticus]
MGDYLGVANKGGSGELVRSGAGLSGAEDVLFSCRAELLVSKFGRSSKPAPRMIVLTTRHVYIVVQTLANNQLVISSERTIPVGAIKSASCSNLKDDWFSLVVGSPQEPDPLINCYFKTEFFTHLNTALRGLNLKIADHVEYNKKPGKIATVKAVKDSTVPRDDLYKSGQIHTGPGEPANSVSKPTPRPKQVAARPVTTGKLLRPGGPGGAPSKLAARPRPAPAPQPLPQSRPQPAAAPTPKPVPQPVAAVAAATATGHGRTGSTGSMKAPPPPPPPASAPAPKKPT